MKAKPNSLNGEGTRADSVGACHAALAVCEMRLKHPVGPYTVTTAARRYSRHRQHTSTTNNAYDSCVRGVRASGMVPDS